MKILSGPHRRRSEAGVALLIAIFVLMLIGVTAIAMILSSGTESALAGNYRSSASAYYAARAGLEEARGRLLPNNADNLSAILPPPGGLQLPLGNVIYIRNPNPLTGETVNPTDLSNPATYPDTEYAIEFAGTPYATPTVVQMVNSVSPAAGLPGPLYKWVRINGATEKSIGVDVDSNHSPTTLDSTTPLFYDSGCLDTPGHLGPTLCLNHSSNAVQALEVTALASLPNGTQKLLQYVVTPFSPPLNFSGGAGSQSPSFPAALTLVGNNVNFDGPSSDDFNINGNDLPRVGACAPGQNLVAAIGYTNGSDSSLRNILSGNVTANRSHYSGAGTLSPNVSNVTGLPPNYQTPSGLDALVQSITQGADVVVSVPPGQSANPSVFPPAMTASNPNPVPMTIVVNGNLDLTGWHNTGYGLLVVTGTFYYDPDASWNGIIMVVGQGQFVSTRGGTGQINGAVLVARTRDSSGHLLPNLGAASFTQNGPDPAGRGIYYSTCWLNAVAGPQRPMTYKVLSYRQLSQ
jgi:hypothetical protein